MKLLIGLVFALVASTANAQVQVTSNTPENMGVHSKIVCGANIDCTETAQGALEIDAEAAQSHTTLTVSGTSTLSGDVVGDGGDSVYGYLENQVAASVTALTAAQCGSTILSAGAAVQPLPEASTVIGCRYTFICGTADDFDINPDDADQFGPINNIAAGTSAAITPSAGDAIRCTDIGSSLTVEAVSASLWSAVGTGNGAWTDVN